MSDQSVSIQDKSSDGEKDESAKVDPWMKAAKEVITLHPLLDPIRRGADAAYTLADS